MDNGFSAIPALSPWTPIPNKDKIGHLHYALVAMDSVSSNYQRVSLGTGTSYIQSIDYFTKCAEAYSVSNQDLLLS